MSQQEAMPGIALERQVRIRTAFNRSINITRDSDSLVLVGSYLPTSRALAALTQIASGLSTDASPRALALIGPYGSGKSAFALFLGALLSGSDDPMRQLATKILHRVAPSLADHIQSAVTATKGFMRIQVNGIPDSLVRCVLSAMSVAAERHGLAPKLVKHIHELAHPDTPMDQVLALIEEVKQAWAAGGGGGLLIEIDELGKFLEFESYHPQHNEIHLLQLLAEKAAETSAAPLHLVVMLHQAFEHYSNRLGKNLRDEWQKVQGRFGTIAFLEPAEQSLRVVGAAFERDSELPAEVMTQITKVTERLAAESALPVGLEQESAQQLFEHCYPLHPLTLLMLPILCQKVAQNERTLFSYLSSSEPFGLRQRLAEQTMGDWVGPWELYDYFILNQVGGFSDPLTYHRWVEVITALERFDGATDGNSEDPALRLLKTIGLLNLIGAQRGLKPSRPLLELLFGKDTPSLLTRIEDASIVHFRTYSGEYRVWQGSDFDLHGALEKATAEQSAQPLADTLNNLSPLKPIVARRASIEIGTLRTYEPAFTSRERWPPKPSRNAELSLWFYLAEPEEKPELSATPVFGVVAVCHFTERLRELVLAWTALKDLPRDHAVLHQDPVAQREHQAWLLNAEADAIRAISGLLEEPETLDWHFGGKPLAIAGRRGLQRELSRWVTETCYPQAPLIRNELINRERPSGSAATGRKRLLAAMLANPEQDGLAIEKMPPEKSLYLSLLKKSGLHRLEKDRWDFYPPLADDPCHLRPVWDAIADTLGDDGGRQVGLPELYTRLQQPPFGVRLAVLPILIVTYLLAHRSEVALYQEGAFCETLSIEQAELLCRRPALFALERFELTGLRGDLFEQYLGSIVGNLRDDASLLDIVRPLVRFTTNLPEYSMHCAGLSPEAERVRNAFRQAKSPGTLLFDSLPLACGIDPKVFTTNDPTVVEGFINQLIQVLRELKRTYPELLKHWRLQLNQELLDSPINELAELRLTLAERYRGLDRYTPDHSPVGIFVRRLADRGLANDDTWLESVLTLLGNAPPAKWRECARLKAELRISELGSQLRELERLRESVPNEVHSTDALLIKVVDAEQGEVSQVLRLSAKQRQIAATSADRIAQDMVTLDNPIQIAVLAELLKRLTRANGEQYDD